MSDGHASLISGNYILNNFHCYLTNHFPSLLNHICGEIDFSTFRITLSQKILQELYSLVYLYILFIPTAHQKFTLNRVWEGIFGIRELTKIRCGIREKVEHLNGKQDFTATIASPQTSFGARSSRIHFSRTERGRNECVANEPQRTSAGRLQLPGKRDSPKFKNGMLHFF